MWKQIVTVAGGGFVVLSFLSKLGINTNKILNFTDYSREVDFRVKSIHGFQVKGGVNGTAEFLVDLDVINKSTSDVLLSRLFITAYNEQNELIGHSSAYTRRMIVRQSATTTVSDIKLQVRFSSVLFDYTLPALLEVIRKKTWQNVRLGRTVMLNISLELNGNKVSKKVKFKI